MRRIIWTGTLLLAALALATQVSTQQHSATAHSGGSGGHAMAARYGDLKWQPIVPELGADSPQISVLRVDPKTQATQLLIHMPKRMHVPMHWHSANETHTMIVGTAVFECDGKRVEIGPGGFNYMPAKMVHEAWLPAGSLTFITVDAAWDINWMEGPPTAADLTK